MGITLYKLWYILKSHNTAPQVSYRERHQLPRMGLKKQQHSLLCFFPDAIPVSRALYGPGIGDIFYDDVDCTGRESNVTQCDNRGLRVHNCQHSEDAGVLCQREGKQ